MPQAGIHEFAKKAELYDRTLSHARTGPLFGQTTQNHVRTAITQGDCSLS